MILENNRLMINGLLFDMWQRSLNTWYWPKRGLRTQLSIRARLGHQKRVQVLVLQVLVLIAIGLVSGAPHTAAHGQNSSTVTKTTPVTTEPTIANQILISTVGARTRIAIKVSKPIAAHAYVLADPPRVVVDAPDMEFDLDEAALPGVAGLVAAYRYGLIGTRQSRLVVDLTGPARLVRTDITPASAETSASFAIELETTSIKAFQTAAATPATAKSSAVPFAKGAMFEDGIEWPKVSHGLPVIMIDPGHGGIDPGALSAGDIREKDVVLAVSRQLAAALTAHGRFDVRMTRTTDVFVPLDQRIELSKSAGASLFISIHADSIDASTNAQNIRGATIYTLSETASNRDAQALADKENAADALAGMISPSVGGNDQVKGILIDLMKRETQNFSSEVRGQLIQNMKGVMTMARDPARSAAFKVLRQPTSPAVLIELGYMSHAQDVALLQSTAWQKAVAKSIATAIDAYFAKRTALVP
jgi:N-acetylmuramoyl-L-alanine amidase